MERAASRGFAQSPGLRDTFSLFRLPFEGRLERLRWICGSLGVEDSACEKACEKASIRANRPLKPSNVK